MGYMRLGNYRVRENGKKKKNIFDKVYEIKSDLRSILPEVEESKYIRMFSRCNRYYMGRLYKCRVRNKKDLPVDLRMKDDLTANERILYDYLLKNKLNPTTTYRWVLAVRIPDDIREKLEKNLISARNAMEISANRKRVKESNQGILMMEELRTVVRGL